MVQSVDGTQPNCWNLASNISIEKWFIIYLALTCLGFVWLAPLDDSQMVADILMPTDLIEFSWFLFDRSFKISLALLSPLLSMLLVTGFGKPRWVSDAFHWCWYVDSIIVDASALGLGSILPSTGTLIPSTLAAPGSFRIATGITSRVSTSPGSNRHATSVGKVPTQRVCTGCTQRTTDETAGYSTATTLWLVLVKFSAEKLQQKTNRVHSHLTPIVWEQTFLVGKHNICCICLHPEAVRIHWHKLSTSLWVITQTILEAGTWECQFMNGKKNQRMYTWGIDICTSIWLASLEHVGRWWNLSWV